MSEALPLSRFKRVSPNVLVLPALDPPAKGPEDAPDLIIINAWMGAALKHVGKYVAPYINTYPNSRIVIVTNEVSDIFTRSVAEQEKRLAPVVDTIRAVVDATTKPKILLHDFSNGGNIQAVRLALVYHKRFGQALPATAIVIDSAPGRSRYQGAVLAFKPALPKNPILFGIGVGLIHAVLSSILLYRYLFSHEDVIEWMRGKLNDPKYFSQEAPRIYIYSETDELVEWRDIEDHAAESEKLGLRVQLVKFDNSRHVAHAIADSDKYWTTISNAWKDAISRS